MSDDRHPSTFDPDDSGQNDSPNPQFQAVLQGYLSRRGMLKGSLGTAATLIMGGGLAACGDDVDVPAPAPAQPAPAPPPPAVLQLNFSPVAKSLADALTVPAGYTARVLYALGDPIVTGLPDYANNGSETGASFALRAGDHHDGMNYYGLGSDGRFQRDSSTRGLICINHENITQNVLHMNGPTIVGPRGCEITGIAMTPDLKTLFVNIQHPGESTSVANMLASTPDSSWPAGGGARPRSATVVITKDDGGTIGGSLV